MSPEEIQEILTIGLTEHQKKAVFSESQKLLVVAGAGSGKTEVMARRIASWVYLKGVPKDNIVAFTFTEKAAEEMKFRIRKWIGKITPADEDATLGRMYVGTIHGFCLQMLQDLKPEIYGVFDVIDDTGRLALIQKWFNHVLGLPALKSALSIGQFETIKRFLTGYDALHEHALFDAAGPETERPEIGIQEREWIVQWELKTNVGEDAVSKAFAMAAARYYGALHARRLLDFSTSQSELVRTLSGDPTCAKALRDRFTHLVVDEFQDINPVQNLLIKSLLGERGGFTAVGDHRQAIYGWRGGRVEIMAEWHEELAANKDHIGKVIELPENFRSTDRIIGLANRWAKTISPLGSLASPDMKRGRASRLDYSKSHVSLRHFTSRESEAKWIAETINKLVNVKDKSGVKHDVETGRDRGIGLSDIAVLVRSATDVRVYMEALDDHGLPAIVRAGPDLFKRPEVLLMIGALALAAGVDVFYGGVPPTMASIARDELNCDAEPEAVVRAAAEKLRKSGFPVTNGITEKLLKAAVCISRKLAGEDLKSDEISSIDSQEFRKWLGRKGKLRRVYPQTLFHWLTAEANVPEWDTLDSPRAISAMFHLGQLSSLITGIETPGWVTPQDLKWQVIALTNWGAGSARSAEAPLLVPPNAVTVSTIHSAKGLEFPVIFLADVAARRFPSQRARTVMKMPFTGEALNKIDPDTLRDNNNYDAERRLMYVALTRSERYLFVSASGDAVSRFERELAPLFEAVGGALYPAEAVSIPQHLPTESDPAFRLVTSFSDLRYYLECPHDYYLRKVLGFSPTIDQAFGYGRGVHNLMRAIHMNPAYYVQFADRPKELRRQVEIMVNQGLFYLRYTTAEPLENMKRRAVDVVCDYVTHYKDELEKLDFEPERAFETLIEEADVLVSGAIDVIRHDDPPHVSLIDFKSGNPEDTNENASSLDEEQMQLQVSLYAVAAKKELEYKPDLGLVRYLGVEPSATREERELSVPLDEKALSQAKETVISVAEDIQERRWSEGPRRPPKDKKNKVRCQECDFILICGLKRGLMS